MTAFAVCLLAVAAGLAADEPAFRRELAEEEKVVSPERFRLDDGYGLVGALDTVAADLVPFLGDSTRSLSLRRGEVAGPESYRVEVSPERVTLTAGDDDGMRRAVYYFEARTRAGDLANCVRKPWLRHRISRCYFGPIKRPPFNTDELMNDVDYYPDAYLNRLAHEGINGLWLTIGFADLAKTRFRPVSETRERRLAKLRRTVEKCRRYGIRTWIFCIEPKMWRPGDPFREAHPEAMGKSIWSGDCVTCTGCAVAREYLEEATRSIFEAVPDLGGILAITHGERYTTCLSLIQPQSSSTRLSCSVCGRLEPWQIHMNTVGAMVKGMRSASPQAEFISWFYQPQPTPVRGEWVAECAKHLPEGTIFQYNFESGAQKEQLGKVRLGGDYWLSYEGPSDPFVRVAAAAREAGSPLSAKIQVGCSHEDATVPFVPAPGLLYRKYREMRKAGVSSVMQCWYFGNYPGLMNAAAGELAFENFSDDEDSFLLRLARPDWGDAAPLAAKTWGTLTRGYMEYPLSNQMQYYGPVHAGCTWPLLADVSMAALPRSWKPQDTPSGDLIGECLENHTLDEALELLDRGWRTMCGDGRADPIADLSAAVPAGDRRRMRDIGLMRALRYQFETARDILEFYACRRDAIYASREKGDFAEARRLLGKMRAIVRREREIGREMERLCRDDPRLGYHSEAEDYRFSAEKVVKRTEGLATTDARLAEIDAALAAGKPWPESAHERDAERWTNAKFLADGSLEIWGRAPNPELKRPVKVYLYDVCGTAFAKSYSVVPSGGEFRLKVPAEDWGRDRRSRPGWMMLDQGNKFGLDSARWPADPQCAARKDVRLNLAWIDGYRFGRLAPATCAGD